MLGWESNRETTTISWPFPCRPKLRKHHKIGSTQRMHYIPIQTIPSTIYYLFLIYEYEKVAHPREWQYYCFGVSEARYTKTFRRANRPAIDTIETDRLLLLSYNDMSETAAFVLRNHHYCCVFGMKMPWSLDVWNEMIFF